ncbi:MAG: YlbF family regulator, partial [Streptococcus sp.]|nr:YlbF family regulator [Streptococcus sp.]
MSKYDQAVDKLVQAIQKHDSVQEFQKVEQKIKTFPQLDSLVDEMKAYQQ